MGFIFYTELKTVESATDIRADINKKYRCVSNNQIHMRNVTVTLHDATIQAYLAGKSFSKEGRTLPPAVVPAAPVSGPSSARSGVALSPCLTKTCVSERSCGGGTQRSSLLTTAHQTCFSV